MLPNENVNDDDLVRAVLCAGHNWDDQTRWTVVLYVYGDISGSAKSDVIMAGCWIAPADRWIKATKSWRQVLKAAGVREFHTTDFNNCKGAFNGWELNGERQIEFAKRFAGIPAACDLLGFAKGLDMPAFRQYLAPELARENRRCKSDNERTYVMTSCLAQVGDWLAQQVIPPPKGSVQVILEGEEGANRWAEFYRESVERREKWAYFFGSVTVAGKELIPLQMADFIAHEAWRRATAVVTESGRPMRKIFEKMMGDGIIDLKVMHKENMIRNAELVRRTLKDVPEGLTRDPAILAGDGQTDDTNAIQAFLDARRPIHDRIKGYSVRAEELNLPSDYWFATNLSPRPYSAGRTETIAEAENKVASATLDEDGSA